MSLAALTSDVRHLGVTRALVRAAYYRANHSLGLRVYQLMSMMPEDVSRELLTRDVRYECRVLDPAEVRAFAADPENAMEPATVARTLAKGDVCFGILDGAVLASCGWYTNAACTVLADVTVTFDPRYLYMYGGYTRPAYRGENLHGIGLARACIALCARGFTGIVTLAERVNFASLRSSHRVGFCDCGIAVGIGNGEDIRIWQSRSPADYAIRVRPTVAVTRERAALAESASVARGDETTASASTSDAGAEAYAASIAARDTRGHGR
jgi:hypothetical protein